MSNVEWQFCFKWLTILWHSSHKRWYLWPALEYRSANIIWQKWHQVINGHAPSAWFSLNTHSWHARSEESHPPCKTSDYPEITMLEKPRVVILADGLSEAQPSSIPWFQTCDWRSQLRSGTSRPCCPNSQPFESSSVIQVTPGFSRHPSWGPRIMKQKQTIPATPCQKSWAAESMCEIKWIYMPLCF